MREASDRGFQCLLENCSAATDTGIMPCDQDDLRIDQDRNAAFGFRRGLARAQEGVALTSADFAFYSGTSCIAIHCANSLSFVLGNAKPISAAPTRITRQA